MIFLPVALLTMYTLAQVYPPSPALFCRQKACHSPSAPIACPAQTPQKQPMHHQIHSNMAIDGTSGRVTQRKRKRPLPASDSSKSTTTNSAPQRGGTCPKSASLSSSATTNSLSGNKKRSRSNTTHNGMSGEGDEMAAEDLDVDEEDGGRGAAACLESSLTSTAGGHGATGKTFTRAIDKPRARSEIVRQVEKLVSNMFKELDVLLRAENINRRVMVRPPRSFGTEGGSKEGGRVTSQNELHTHYPVIASEFMSILSSHTPPFSSFSTGGVAQNAAVPAP